MDMSVFTQAQLIEIKKGQLLGLDITVYAHRKYTACKMHQIRNALWRKKIDKFVWDGISTEQKHEIEFGLIQGVDVSVYASPDYTAAEMESLRRHLLQEASYERCETTRTANKRTEDSDDTESDRSMHT